jgi:hypothetical protein
LRQFFRHENPVRRSAGSFFLNAAHGATFTVTNTANSGPGTLRQAILDANANPGLDTINFNLPGSGVQTIAPTNALPAITNAVFIDGFSQPGSSANTSATGDNSVHLIRLDGYKCRDSFPSGLNFNTAYVFAASAASGSTVRGLCIVRFYHGISATEVSSLTVSGNWIGLDVDGIARGNGGNGVNITASFSLSQSNVIGGSTAERGTSFPAMAKEFSFSPEMWPILWCREILLELTRPELCRVGTPLLACCFKAAPTSLLAVRRAQPAMSSVARSVPVVWG